MTTITRLISSRPDVVIVTNPPLISAAVVAAWTSVTGRTLILDSHPSSFGAKNHRVSQRLIRVHRWLARRASTTMVTTDEWVNVLASWGARGTIVHEAPPLWSVEPMAPVGGSRVLFPGVFAGDEPIETVFDLARLRPDLEFYITGDRAKCPAELRATLPSNVRLVGYLDRQAYAEQVEHADVIMALTTEPTSVMRAAYEAVYARRPLVVSDWRAGKEAFPYAFLAENNAADLAKALDQALTEGRGPALLDKAYREQMDRWVHQKNDLLKAMGATPIASSRRISK